VDAVIAAEWPAVHLDDFTPSYPPADPVQVGLQHYRFQAAFGQV
jgi:hypothetical protein